MRDPAAALCCQYPQALAGAAGPFDRIVALGFYDGPESGVLQCSACRREYRFDKVDEVYNPNGVDVRAFILRPLPLGTVDAVSAVFPGGGPPHRRIWVPLWEFGTADARAAAEARVDALLGRAGPPVLAVAWEGYSDRILGARSIVPDEVGRVNDWFAFMGIERPDPAIGP